ncbi:hypothetical protein [Paenibacillus sp. PDC88]|uniref:Uncharacterized protein n=1 Tax=Paenibacillus provencensis TaxID=441151 RepID=A0ABW3PZH5_9BACL|nr:hypothetical protein [Paenibacillus sp. PDC88]SDX88770.1 hypothetical protein SAMN05518848_12326 [Paenibacillus sp. PDC88]
MSNDYKDEACEFQRMLQKFKESLYKLENMETMVSDPMLKTMVSEAILNHHQIIDVILESSNTQNMDRIQLMNHLDNLIKCHDNVFLYAIDHGLMDV